MTTKHFAVKTFWTPAGYNYSVEHNTTLDSGRAWHAEWVADVEAGKTVIIYDHTNDGSPNPGILTVIANVIVAPRGTVIDYGD